MLAKECKGRQGAGWSQCALYIGMRLSIASQIKYLFNKFSLASRREIDIQDMFSWAKATKPQLLESQTPHRSPPSPARIPASAKGKGKAAANSESESESESGEAGEESDPASGSEASSPVQTCSKPGLDIPVDPNSDSDGHVERGPPPKRPKLNREF